MRVRLGSDGAQVADAAEDIGVLDHHARCLPVDRREETSFVGLGDEFWLGDVEQVAGKLGHRLRDGNIMRVQSR